MNGSSLSKSLALCLRVAGVTAAPASNETSVSTTRIPGLPYYPPFVFPFMGLFGSDQEPHMEPVVMSHHSDPSTTQQHPGHDSNEMDDGNGITKRAANNPFTEQLSAMGQQLPSFGSWSSGSNGFTNSFLNPQSMLTGLTGGVRMGEGEETTAAAVGDKESETKSKGGKGKGCGKKRK